MAAEPLSSGAERFRDVQKVFLFNAEGVPVPPGSFEIESVWEHRGSYIFKFRGIDSISVAERLEGAEVRIPRVQRAALPEGEYYQSDLIGCEVVEMATGGHLGTVAAWREYGGPPLLEVREAADVEPILIPFARAICREIDLAARRIVVDLPEGLKELDRK